MTRSTGIAVLACGLAAFALAASAAPGAAQKTSATVADTVTLGHVEDLVEAGRTEDARGVLLKWWSDVLPKASTGDVQRGLWLRARLTVDPGQAALDYRRLVVEYPGGPYSAQALFRLAQAAWEAGDSVGAAREVARLGREYPGSRVRSEAGAWLAAAGPPPPPPPAAQKEPTPAGAPDSTAPPARSDTSPARPAAPPPSARSPHRQDTTTAATGRYAVQLGAFSTDARARTVQRRAQSQGFEARLVDLPGSRLVHVRVGRFDSASAAGDLLKRLKGLGFTAAVVTDANHEEPIRR